MLDKIKRVKQIKTIFKKSTEKLKEIDTIGALEFQIGNLNGEIEKLLNTFSKETSKTSDTYVNLNCFVNYKFNLSEKEGEKFTKSLTTWLYNKNNKKTRIILNPMSSIFLAKKEIIAWGKELDKAVTEVNKKENINKNEENRKKKEKFESAQLKKKRQSTNKLYKSNLSQEEKELEELLDDDPKKKKKN